MSEYEISLIATTKALEDETTNHQERNLWLQGKVMDLDLDLELELERTLWSQGALEDSDLKCEILEAKIAETERSLFETSKALEENFYMP